MKVRDKLLFWVFEFIEAFLSAITFLLLVVVAAAILTKLEG